MSKRKRLSLTKDSVSDSTQPAANKLAKGTEQSLDNLEGTAYLSEVNGRSWRGRHMKKAYSQLVSDLGGPDNVSFAESEIARRCAALSILGLEMETSIALFDEKFNAEDYIILCRAQTQLLKTLGIRRKQKKVNPGDDGEKVTSLEDYLKEHKTG